MRKLIQMLLLTVLVCSLVLHGYAAQTGAVLTDATAGPGDIIHMTLRLPEGVRGNAVGISYTYDTSLLERLPADSVWCKKGVLKDFSTQRSEGVWACADTADLSGDCCILAFRIREGVTFDQTQVSCTVTVKSGADQAGSYTVTGTVLTRCDHSYGQWQTVGLAGHIQTCEKCADTLTASHQWDGGKEAADPGDPAVTIRTTTCTVCGEKREERYRSDVQVITPSYPVPTQPEDAPLPTFPLEEEAPEPFFPTEKLEEEEPYRDTPKETRPNSGSSSTGSGQNQQDKKPQGTIQTPDNQLTDYNARETTAPGDGDGNPSPYRDSQEKIPGSREDSPSQREPEHDHDVSRPIAIPIETGEASAQAEITPEAPEVHDHSHTPAQVRPASVFTAVALSAVLIAALAFFLRKKRR